MRFIVLFFGFLGCVLTAVFSFMVLFQAPAKVELHQLLQEHSKDVDFILDAFGKDYLLTGLFLLLASVIGFLGTLLAFFRCGWQGALLLLVPIIGPAILNPVTLVGTAVQAFTALLCMLFVGPLPLQMENEDNDDDDEDDD